MSDEEHAALVATIDGLLLTVVIALENAKDPLKPLGDLRRLEETLRQMNMRSETIAAVKRVREMLIERAASGPPQST